MKYRFLILSLIFAGCTSRELNPICWIPLPGWEAKRLEMGHEVLDPIIVKLNEYKREHGFYPNQHYFYDEVKLGAGKDGQRLVSYKPYDLQGNDQIIDTECHKGDCTKGYRTAQLRTGVDVYCPPSLVFLDVDAEGKETWKLHYMSGK